MPGVRRALRDPASQQFDFSGLEFLARVGRRHDVDLALIGDPEDHLAALRLSRNDRRLARFCGLERSVAKIEPQFGLARTLIRPMTFEAVFREDWADVTI